MLCGACIYPIFSLGLWVLLAAAELSEAFVEEREQATKSSELSKNSETNWTCKRELGEIVGFCT